MSHVNENTRCLACDSENLHVTLDLGMSPLANAYKNSKSQTEEFYPLAVNLCHSCYHLQLSHTVDPGIIYKNYMYATGTNQTIQQYCEWFAGFVNEYTAPKTVLDIGCNDGTQLNYFSDLGVTTYGIDPAENLHERIRPEHNVICDFFEKSSVKKLAKNKYDAIVAQNVFAHNPKPVEFLKSCKKLMGPQTLLFIQTSQANMVLNNEFDTIYHEHVNFFNANSMDRLATRAGLYLQDVIKTPIHGNSYIFILGLDNRCPYNVANIIVNERASGLYTVNTYQNWAKTVEYNVSGLAKVVGDYREQGFHVVGYGAAAKGMTLINYANLHLDFIIDDNPLKQEKYTPGTNTHIVSNEKLEDFTDDDKILFIPLAWNFYDEIRQRIQKVRQVESDRFLRYFPKVTVST